MFDLLSLVSIVFNTKEIIEEKLEKPAPKNARFDWDAYWEDVRNGMSAMEQVRKRERGGYMTTKPLA